MIDDQTACVVVQSPDVFGLVRDLRPIAEAVHAKGALLIAVVTEIVSLGLVESPGAMGADIVAAEGQSIGNGLNFGGPYVGLFATREKFLRQMPGRLVGETHRRRGQARLCADACRRASSISAARRRPATSAPIRACARSPSPSICRFSAKRASRGWRALNHARAAALADRLAGIKGVTLVTQAFFNEFTLKLPKPAAPSSMRSRPRASSPACRLPG